MQRTGFTVIELLVALGIFTVALLVLFGTYGNVVTRQREALAQQELQENLRYALEQLAREIRTGYGTTYTLVAGSVEALAFRNQRLECVRYDLQNGQLRRSVNGDQTVDCEAASSYGQGISLTSPELDVARLYFEPHLAQEGTAGELAEQGFVTWWLRAAAAGDPDRALTVQSTVTSRQTKPYGAL